MGRRGSEMSNRTVIQKAIEAAAAKLGDLYRLTGDDWSLEISVPLTEPVCPVVRLVPDGAPDSTRYTAHADTVDDGITKVVDAAYREMVLKQPLKGSLSPFSNPSDRNDRMSQIVRGDFAPDGDLK